MIYIIPFLFLIFLFFLYRKSQSFYPYSTSSDYQYNFKKDFSLDYKQGQKLSLPQEKVSAMATTFMKVEIKSSILGYFVQPYIEIKSEKGIFKQYVEHGAKGKRYINISDIGKEFTLTGKRLQIKNQEVSFFTFQNENLSQKKILFLSPHADDAEIAGYGFYSKYAKNVCVVTMSAGEKGKFKYRELYTDKQEQHLKKGQIRIWNALTVPMLAGVPTQNILTLGLFNETLEDMYNEQDKIIPSKILDTHDVTIFTQQNFSPLAEKLENVSNWKSIVRNLETLIKEFQPDIIVTPYPYIDSHEDHQYTTIACLEALKNLKITKGELFLYTNHYTDAEYYPYGKIGSIMSIPPKFDGSIYFDKIYSHPLSVSEQKDKILAFDAMNDLRPNTEYRFYKRLFSDGFTRMRERFFSVEKDYFNRYVRSNELFFVVDIKNIYNQAIYQQITKHS